MKKNIDVLCLVIVFIFSMSLVRHFFKSFSISKFQYLNFIIIFLFLTIYLKVMIYFEKENKFIMMISGVGIFYLFMKLGEFLNFEKYYFEVNEIMMIIISGLLISFSIIILKKRSLK